MLKFSQEEIEGKLSTSFPYGTIKQVSIGSGIGKSYLDQWINPNDGRPSPAFRLLQIQCALDDYNLELGQAHWLQMVEFREASLPNIGERLDLDTESLRNHKESFDVAQAKMSGKPLYDQLKEVLEQESQVVRHKNAILQAINAERSNGGASRFSSRDFARSAVEGRK